MSRAPSGSVLAVADEVRQAVAEGRPVLALESTIFTHGLPRPRNLEVALEAEERVRAAGVVPATIGIHRGVPTVGLTTAQVEELASTGGVAKASLRDVAVLAARGVHGGTTVAATGYLAALAGVRVFSTGGLGGVHRGAPTTFDESSDLGTLATLPLVVVSAGVKSILDIPLTLERLETLNLAVVGYRTRDYPAFYVADSGFDLEHSVESAQDVARIVEVRDGLGIRSTLLVALPVDAAAQLAPEEHDRVLGAALAAAQAGGVAGNETTPFLLDFMQRETGGRSLDVNVAVYRGNVALGADIARALAGR